MSTDYLQRLQSAQLAEGREVWSDLPDYAAEYMVDSIIAITKAISSVQPEMWHNGTLVTSHLRNLSFNGVSGLVSFTEEGDRRDAPFSIFNLQMKNGSLLWVDVEALGFTDGGANRSNPGVDGICLGATNCNLETLPSDKYPVRPKNLTFGSLSSYLLFLRSFSPSCSNTGGVARRKRL